VHLESFGEHYAEVSRLTRHHSAAERCEPLQSHHAARMAAEKSESGKQQPKAAEDRGRADARNAAQQEAKQQNVCNP